MIKLKQIALTLLLSFAIQGCATGATYYVKTGGNDRLDGLSDGNAWETLNKIAISSFNAGDTIKLNSGDTWAENLTFPSSGTVGNVITLTNYGTGANPVINRLVFTLKHDIAVSNLETNSTGVYEYGCMVLGSYNFTFDNCVFDGNNQRADAFLTQFSGTEWTHDITITNCMVKDVGDIDNGAEGGTGFQIASGSYNVLIEDCDALECEEAGFQVFTNTVYWGTWDSHDVTFRRCYVFLTGHTDISSQAIVIGWKAYNTLVDKCFTVGTRHGMTVDHNITGPNRIQNSIFYNGLECFVAVGCNNLTVVNNTFIAGPNTVKTAWFRTGCVSGNVFKNNISISLQSWWQNLIVDTAGSVDSDYNRYYNTILPTEGYFSQGANTYNTLAGWQTATGLDLNSTCGNPLFRSATDYRLQKNSPCRGVGASLVGIVDDDYDGTPRPLGGVYDIGAYQYYKAKVRGNATLRHSTI